MKVIWPNIKTIVKFWEKQSAARRPSSKSYQTVLEATNDILTTAKLSVFSFIASLFESYLTKYQTDKPMVPFLGQVLEKMYRNVLRLFIKPNELAKCTSPIDLLKLILDDPSIYLKRKGMHFGFDAEEILSNLLRQDQIEVSKVSEFKKDVRQMIIVMVQKMLEKGPLRSVVIRNAHVFDPTMMINLSQDTLRGNMRTLLRHLVSVKLLSPNVSDKALTQYIDLLTTKLLNDAEKFKSFDCEKDRLDEFFFSTVSFSIPEELKSVLILILVLSHGQASVVRSFSVNNTILKVNMEKTSIVSRKIIVDHMRNNSLLPSTITLTKELIRSVKGARQKYQIQQDQQRSEQKKKQQTEQLVILNQELRDLQTRRQQLIEVSNSLDKDFVETIKLAEKQKDLKSISSMIAKGNGLKRKSEEKLVEASKLLDAINVIEAKRKKIL